MKAPKYIISTLMTILIGISLVGCHPTSKRQTSLYQQLGGEPVVDTLTRNLVDRLFKHEKIGFLFIESDANREDLIKHIFAQICVETGGNCVYEGRDMAETHSGLAISKAEFDIFVTVFIAAMQDTHIPVKQQNQLLALFAVMRDDIIHQ